MHTNAGVVTALQQAVAHLIAALERLTNTDMNMLMCTCSNMDAEIHASVSVNKAGEVFIISLQCGTASTRAGFYVISAAD